MADTLIAAKQADGFKSESPIRAFTDFQVSGSYAIGKGFRPSMAHLSRYLDAMEAKEGWRLVQIILPDNDAADPTILFHKVGVPAEQLELTSDQEVMNVVRKIVIGLGQLRDDMIGQAEARMEDTSVEAKGFLSEAMDQYADRLGGYADELAALVGGVPAPNTVFRRLLGKRPALAAPYTPSEPHWTDPGSELDIPVEYHEEALRFIAERRGMDADRLVRDFMLYFKPRNQPNQVTHTTFESQLGFICPAIKRLDRIAHIAAFRDSKRPDIYQRMADDLERTSYAACGDLGRGLEP